MLTLHLWRLEQEAELTRLAQTLMLVPRLTWIVVEDSKLVTARLKRILERFNTLNIVLTAGEGYHSHTRQYKTHYAYITDQYIISLELLQPKCQRNIENKKVLNPEEWLAEMKQLDGLWRM